MKAYHNYTTTMTTAIWLWRGAAVLLTFTALILGLMVLWRTNGQSALPLATSDSFTRHAAEPIASCRACRDEWVAAQAAPITASTSGTIGRPQSMVMPTVSHAAGPITPCRVCHDEWIAAQTIQSIPAAISASTSGFALEQPEENTRTSGPR